MNRAAPSSRLCRHAFLAAVALPLAAASFVAAPASANPVRGQLNVSGLAAAASARDSHWEEWNGAVARRENRLKLARRLTVVLTGEGTAMPVSYAFRGGALETDTIVVRAGSSFAIENTDIFDHELSADGLAALPPLSTAPGQTRTASAAAPGEWALVDRAHPGWRGKLVAVTGLVARGSTDDSGRFSFADVPPGRYTLRVFHEGSEVAAVPVEVSGAKEAVVAPLSVKVPPPRR